MPQKYFRCRLDEDDYTFEHCLKVCKGKCQRGNLLFLARMIPNERPVIEDQWSTTQIVAPPQITLLKQRYDYSAYPESNMFAAWGTAWHKLMEEGKQILEDMDIDTSDFMIEDGFIVKVPTSMGYITLTGIPDLYIKSCQEQWDYKTTKAYVMGKKWSEQEEWFWQANIYRHYKNKESKALLVGGAIRDFGWDTRERDGLSEFSIKETPIYLGDDIENYVTERLVYLKTCQDNNLYPRYCTERERWFGWDRMRKKDVYRRCERYCGVSTFCRQWREENAKAGG